MKYGKPKDEPLLQAALANCDPCKRGAHIACTKRANDEGVTGACWCAEVEHRSRRAVREELDNDR